MKTIYDIMHCESKAILMRPQLLPLIIYPEENK